MPRANRYFLPGYIWHITHRCHKQEFLLKFARDRRRWMHWLFEARKRYDLCVLNYVVTSNHIHLLVKDNGGSAISRSLQLIEGRTAQAFNRRKGRKGAFWEDRYHATAVESGAHLFNCLVYIDLNMVRAGVVRHPLQWVHSGYREIQAPPTRYRIIDMDSLLTLTGQTDVHSLQLLHQHCVEQALQSGRLSRDTNWTESLAVGGNDFVTKVQELLEGRAKQREVITKGEHSVLREQVSPYRINFEGEKGVLSSNNRFKWNVFFE